ncbi:unnamed protein product, partial [Closterium sp. Yama58-4]
MARVSFIALLVLALSCAACVSRTSAAKVVRDGTLQWTLITQALQKGGQHSTYLSIVNKAGTKFITDYLSTSTTGFTCFVPTNAAFKVQMSTVLKPFAKSATTLQDLLKNHMLNFQALPPRFVADKVGQGYTTFRPNGQIQKYQGAGKTISLGPQFAQQGTQLANITKATCVSVSDKMLALGTSDGCVHVLDLLGNQVKQYESHKAPVRAVVFDAAVNHIASCAHDGSLAIHGLFSPDCLLLKYRLPLLALALHPSFGSSRRSRQFATGGEAGELVLNSKGWLGASDQ